MHVQIALTIICLTGNNRRVVWLRHSVYLYKTCLVSGESELDS